jgi:hypothetical protein
MAARGPWAFESSGASSGVGTELWKEITHIILAVGWPIAVWDKRDKNGVEFTVAARFRKTES